MWIPPPRLQLVPRVSVRVWVLVFVSVPRHLAKPRGELIRASLRLSHVPRRRPAIVIRIRLYSVTEHTKSETEGKNSFFLKKKTRNIRVQNTRI